MSEQEDFETEDLEAQEDGSENTEHEQPQYLTKDDLNSFKQEMLEVFRSQGASKTEAKQETATFTEQQLQEFAQNPALLAQYVESKTKESETKLSRKLDTEKWDRKAEQEFPHLKEKEFEKLVVEEIKNLVHYGDMDKNSPRLLYMAARNANSRYAKKSQGAAVKSTDSALSPKGAKPSKAPSREDKEFLQRTQMLRANGWSEDRIKKAFDKYNSSTEVRKSEESGRIRRRTLLK